MINNLELVLCAQNYRSIEEPAPVSYQKILESDILPDAPEGPEFAKFPVHLVRIFKKGNRAA